MSICRQSNSKFFDALFLIRITTYARSMTKIVIQAYYYIWLKIQLMMNKVRLRRVSAPIGIAHMATSASIISILIIRLPKSLVAATSVIVITSRMRAKHRLKTDF